MTPKYYIYIILFITSTLYSQQVDSLILNESTFVTIDSIKIIGNEKTEDFVILRELDFTVGDSVNSNNIIFSKERIFSLGLFTYVDIYILEEDNFNKAYIEVKESWYIFPIPFIIIREKNFERVSYGISFKYKNFRGRNETLAATISLGYDPFFLLSYSNPVLIESAEIGFDLSGVYQTPINKSPAAANIYGSQFDFKVIYASIIFSKRLSINNHIFALFGYSYTEAPSINYSGIMASSSNIDRSFFGGFGYTYDSRDLKQFANNGTFIQADYVYKGIGDKEISYNIFNMRYREYRNINKYLFAKWRVDYRHTFGKFIPPYDHSFLGYDLYVRGDRNVIREGNNLLIGSLEFVSPVIKDWNYSIDLPIIPTSLSTARIQINIGIFGDAGLTYYNGDKISFNDFNSGYGVGIYILFLPYSSFSFQFAINEHGKGEYLFESGISF